MTDHKRLDCRGLPCPQPVIDTKQALQGSTGPILVVVDNEGSCTNVRRFAESQGAEVSVEQLGSDFQLTIAPGASAAAAAEPIINCSTGGGPQGMVVFVSSETLGHGDEELGRILMAAFLDTLSQFGSELTHAIFINSGAKLTVEGSPVLEQLRQLEQVGARLLVCGTCLKHFGIEDELAVGSVSNMYTIIETLTKTGRIVRP